MTVNIMQCLNIPDLQKVYIWHILNLLNEFQSIPYSHIRSNTKPSEKIGNQRPEH